MFIDFILSMNIVALILIVILVIIVAYKVLIKREKPKSMYTPFDYITGQTDEEFKEEEEEVNDD